MSGLAPGAATMTVLFTDLVGSTATRARLGDDQADLLHREHDDLLARVISDHRGTVVKGLGDGLMAVFHAPSEALAAAVGINQAVSRRNRKAREPLTLRMGMSIGEIRVEGDDVFGTPVIEASRLCATAADDQILVSTHVRALVGSRTPVAFKEVGELELKGLAEPLTTWEATWWEATDAVAVPCPDLALLQRRSRFVGRKLERFALADAWSRARAGRGPVVVVSGADGAGKSRLAMEFARAQHDEGAIVLAGRCDAKGIEPYQPFVEALRFQVGHLSDAQLPEQLGPGAGALTRLLPELSQRLGAPAESGVAAEVQRLRLFDAVVAWLESTARRQPVVLLLDDLHQATPSTLGLVEHLARSTANIRALLVATWRTEGDGDGDGPVLERALASWRASHRGAEHIPLGPLDPKAVAELVSDRLGEGVDQRAGRLAPLLCTIPRAVPGTCVEVLDDLVSSGAVTSQAGHWSFTTDPDALAMPTDLASLWRKRLAALPDDARSLVDVAAVLGDEFPLALVRPVLARLGTPLTDGQLQAALDDATLAGLLEAPSGERSHHAFAHPLVPVVILEGLEAAKRRTLHLAAADGVERHVGPNRERAAFELAHQVLAAVRPPASSEEDDAVLLARAVDLATAAGNQARLLHADVEAVGWYRRALEIHGRMVTAADYRWLDLCMAAGDAAAAGGLVEAEAFHRQAVEVAGAMGDRVGLLRAVLASRAGLLDEVAPCDPVRLEALLDAAELADRSDPVARARVLAHLAVEVVGSQRSAERFAWLDEAQALARAGSDRGVQTEVARLGLTALDGPDRLDRRRGLCDELATLAETTDDPLARFRVAVERARLAWAAGRRPELDAALEQARLVGVYLRDPRRWWQVMVLEAASSYLLGDLDAAAAQAADALRYRPGDPRAAAAATDLGLAVARLRGTLDDDGAGLDEAIGAASGLSHLRLACIATDTGRLDPARAEYEGWLSAGSPLGDGPEAGTAAVSLAHVACLLGDPDGAAVLQRFLEPHADAFFGDAEPLPVVAHVLAMLAVTRGEGARAHTLFERSVVLHEGFGAPLLAAESRLEWARLNHAVGEDERARVLAEQARAAARTHGAAGLEAQARSLLVTIETPGRRFGETGR